MEIKPIYLFYGEERYLLHKDVSIFRSYFLKEGVAAEEFDGSKTSLAAIVAAAAEVPLFGGRRLIIVDRAPWFSGKKKGGEEVKEKKADPGVEEFLAYAARPNTETCLVFICDSADKRMKTVKAVAEVGTVREYAAKKSYELPDYIHKYLAKQRKRIAPKATDLLLEYVGDDIGLLSGEMDKLVLFADERERIEADDVERVVSRSAEASLFALSDAIGARRKRKVRETLTTILDRTKPGDYAMVFGYLVNYFRLLLRIKDLSAARMSEKAIVRETGVHAFRVKKGMEAARNYSAEELCGALAAMLDCDYKVKSGRWEYGDGLFATIMKIVN